MPKECALEINGQYVLPDSVLSILGGKSDRACLLIDAMEKNNREVQGLKQSYDKDRLQIISLEGVGADQLKRIKNCALFLKAPWQAVLLDKERRIRGYYAFTNLDETDRLKVEIEILLTQ